MVNTQWSKKPIQNDEYNRLKGSGRFPPSNVERERELLNQPKPYGFYFLVQFFIYP